MIIRRMIFLPPRKIGFRIGRGWLGCFFVKKNSTFVLIVLTSLHFLYFIKVYRKQRNKNNNGNNNNNSNNKQSYEGDKKMIRKILVENFGGCL